MNKFLLGAGAVSLACLAIFFYGQHSYKKGYTQSQTEVALEEAHNAEILRAKELAMFNSMEEVRRDALKKQQQVAVALTAAHADLTRLRHTIANQSKASTIASASPRTDAVASACWVALDESVQRYTEVGQDADGYVERLRIGQGWAKAITSPQ